MEQNTDAKHREIARTEILASSSSDLINKFRKSIGAPIGTTEPHLLKKNSSSHHSIATRGGLSNATAVHTRQSIVFDKKVTLPSIFRHSIPDNSDEKESTNAADTSDVVVETNTEDLMNLVSTVDLLMMSFIPLVLFI